MSHFIVSSVSAEVVTEVCRILTAGCVVALPTDTVYGLAALVTNTDAVNSLYRIKGRDRNNPIAICLANVDDIERWAHVEILHPKLLPALLPGRVTVVLDRKPTLNPALNPGNPKVGIRIPGSTFICDVVKALQLPLALTSANTSKKGSSLSPNEFKHLWPMLGGVLHDDENEKTDELRAGSTVVDLSVEGKYSIVREGVCLAAVREKLKEFNLVDNTE